VSYEVEQLSARIERQDQQLSDLLALARRGDSRIVTLREQLSRSRAEMESMSARFTELAGTIPADVGKLEDRLAAVLNAATAEAEEIRADALRFGETVRTEAEERAARIVAEAQLEYQQATELRSDMEAQSKQIRDDIARLREQAALNAAQILAEAESHAEEMLAQVQRDIDAQCATAEAKLDELNLVRAKIVAQLQDFYAKFNALDRPAERVDRITVISVASALSDLPSSHDLRSSYGAHAARDTEIAPRSLGDVG
jgi:chromosome segregation ATPase